MQRILRTRLVTALILVVVFGAGAVSGAAWDRGFGTRHDTPPSRPARREPVFMQVHPTARQKTEIDSIVKERHAAFENLHEEFRKALEQFHETYDPRYDSLIKDTRDAIKSVLTPAQAVQYDSLLARMDRRRAERAQRDGRN